MGKRGAFSIEYAVFIVVLIASLVAMSVYITRAVCGKFRESADTFGHGRQYAP
ncbi:MAG: hypothetical protein WC723_02900 [Candidatus Omnitrophota bacterium]